MQELFKAKDTNKNNVLTEDEYLAFYASLSSSWKEKLGIWMEHREDIHRRMYRAANLLKDTVDGVAFEDLEKAFEIQGKKLYDLKAGKKGGCPKMMLEELASEIFQHR